MGWGSAPAQVRPSSGRRGCLPEAHQPVSAGLRGAPPPLGIEKCRHGFGFHPAHGLTPRWTVAPCTISDRAPPSDDCSTLRYRATSGPPIRARADRGATLPRRGDWPRASRPARALTP